LNARREHAPQRIRQQSARRIQNREVIKPGGMRRRWRTTPAFPRVERDMMMIPTRGKKHRLCSVARRDPETKHIAIKFQRTVNVSDLEMHVADPDPRVDWFLVHAHRYAQLAKSASVSVVG